MEKHLNRKIKELITEFPAVADILNSYNIGCVPCSVGSCLLKDIVEIHNLSVENERQLLLRIAGVLYPGKAVAIPALKRKTDAPGTAGFSPPIKRLVDEHLLIKKWLALIPLVIENIDPAAPRCRRLLLDGLDFIRFYADRFHHAKEEDILFSCVDGKPDIIQVMLDDHQAARAHVKAISAAIDAADRKAITDHLEAYRELLSGHIKKEDEILYPWIDRNLSITQVGELSAKFDEAEKRLDAGVIERCVKFAHEAEERITELHNKKTEVSK